MDSEARSEIFHGKITLLCNKMQQVVSLWGQNNAHVKFVFVYIFNTYSILIKVYMRMYLKPQL